jgi:hypothetical protein
MINWDEIHDFYIELAQNPRQSWASTVIHAKALLEALPYLQQAVELDGLHIGMAHVTLFVALPHFSERVIGIWGESLASYAVYFMDSEGQESDKTITDIGNLVDTLADYIQKLQVEFLNIKHP